MRSKIVEQILENTPPEFCKYVDLYAKIVIYRGELDRHIESFDKDLTKLSDYSIGYVSALRNEREKVNKILR